MSSQQKRQANRINAQRSTGPRSVRGKRSSSLNALRHGLSVPVDQLVQPQIVTRLQQLIEEEGIDPDSARDLSLKILDFERNIARELDSFPPYQEPLPRSSEELMGLIRKDWPEMDMLDDIADEEIFFTGGLSRRTFKTNISMKTKMIKLWFRVDSKARLRARKSQEFADRYLRRASNQLLKSLRAAFA